MHTFLISPGTCQPFKYLPSSKPNLSGEPNLSLKRVSLVHHILVFSFQYDADLTCETILSGKTCNSIVYDEEIYTVPCVWPSDRGQDNSCIHDPNYSTCY